MKSLQHRLKGHLFKLRLQIISSSDTKGVFRKWCCRFVVNTDRTGGKKQISRQKEGISPLDQRGQSVFYSRRKFETCD